MGVHPMQGDYTIYIFEEKQSRVIWNPAAKGISLKKKAMKQAFSIPQPCDEKWNNMTPNEQGRHCAQCCKTVVDFTGMDPDEIAGYLHAQQHHNVCGRFRAEQLTPAAIHPEVYMHRLQQIALPLLKRIAAIFLFVFCLSAQADAQSPQQPQPVKQHPHPIMGKIAPVRLITDTSSKPLQPVKANNDSYIMGDISRPQPIKVNHQAPSVEGRKQKKRGHS